MTNIYFDFNPPVITEPSVPVAEFSTGVAGLSSGQQLLLMPNPTDGLLVLHMAGADVRHGMIRVRSMDGRVVMEQRMSGPREVLDVQGLPAGSYVVEVMDELGGRMMQRFVKH